MSSENSSPPLANLNPAFSELLKGSTRTQEITSFEDVFQSENLNNRKIIDYLLDSLVHPSSFLTGHEHLVQLHELSTSGKSCLIMMEHYSNFDIPGLYYLFSRKFPQSVELLHSIVALAASKLNIHPVVHAFTEAYNRIVIYQAREREKTLSDEELQKIDQLNQWALKKMIDLKSKGKIILFFPSGTRYRPNKPETKKGIPQIANFIKHFDHMCLIGISGNVLHVSDDGMTEDVACKDVLAYSISEVLDCKSFINSISPTSSADKKLHKVRLIEKVMSELKLLHMKAESIAGPLRKENPPKALGPIIQVLSKNTTT